MKLKGVLAMESARRDKAQDEAWFSSLVTEWGEVLLRKGDEYFFF